MKLRSGFETDGLCNKCYEFYGIREWGFKCSVCSDICVIKTKNKWLSEPKFREEVDKWGLDQTLYSKKKKIMRLLKHIIQVISFSDKCSVQKLKITILQIQQKFKENGKKLYITSQDGEELLRKTGIDCIEKSHIICPLVIDWWNMKKFNYNSCELCYYGRYGEPEYHIKSIPPPLPLNFHYE